MLASSGATRTNPGPAPVSEGPNAEDLTLPEHEIRDEGVRGLIAIVNKLAQLRVAVYGHFDDAFERLTTIGDADAYPACVDRFKQRFKALDDDLERIAMRLDALKQPPISNLVRSVVRAERDRYSCKCDEQVLRQRFSLSEFESDERASLKSQMQAATASLAQKAESVEEALEELRAEAADFEDED